MNALARVLPLAPRLARVETGTIRIDVERVAGALQLRIQARSAPAGLASTPSIGMELMLADARTLAALLIKQADVEQGS